MASTKVELENSDRELKRLGFVRLIAIHALVCVLNLYEFAKQNSGPLKSTVGNVENAVTTVVGPVYEKFMGLPQDVLSFFDKKVDEATNKFNESAPPLAKTVVKKVVSQALSLIHKASLVAQDIAREAQVGGPHAAIHYAGALSKQLVLSQLANAWYGVHKYPLLLAVAQLAIPTAAHWSEKYNKMVADMTAKGCAFFSYFPLVPLDEMAKAYKQVEAAGAEKEDEATSSESKVAKD